MKKLILLLLLIPNLVMAEKLSFRCNFTVGNTTLFDKGKPELVDGGKFSELVFDQIDLSSGTGRLIGNAGAENVTVLMGNQSVNILELTAVGNLNVTTIFNLIPNKDGLFPVTHSRHVNIGNQPIISQFSGLCNQLY